MVAPLSRLKGVFSNERKNHGAETLNSPEAKIFDRFVIIMQTEGAVAITEMAGYLRLDEVELMKRLIIWKKKLPFKITGDFIIIEDMTEFLKALEKLPL